MLPTLTARWAVLLGAIALVLGMLVVACAGPDAPAATPIPPTPTPVPDPAAILKETSDNLRDLRSAEFVLRHETGAVFLPAFSAKLTEARGAWDAQQGAELHVDAYLVADAQTEPESGIYLGMQSVITPDAYYGTDPFSGAWLKQPQSFVPIPVTELNRLMADLVDMIDGPVLDGAEEVDGLRTYRISGDAPASVLNWLPLSAEPGQTVRIEVWTDTERRMLRKLRVIGPVGMFDQADTVREIHLSNINGPVSIDPPTEFTDLTGG